MLYTLTAEDERLLKEYHLERDNLELEHKKKVDALHAWYPPGLGLTNAN